MLWTSWEPVKVAGEDFTDITYRKKFHRELGGGVARLAVNRPRRYNSFTDHTIRELLRAVSDANHDPMVGVVLLTGEGDHFGTGGDVEWEHGGGLESGLQHHPPNRVARLSLHPVIAAIHGFCIGGSNHLAYCCDVSIAADNAVFGQNGPRVSSPADGYIVSYLAQVAGAKKARELWMLCHRYSAAEALQMGLVNRVVPLARLDEEIDRWCEDLLRASPACLDILKATFDAELDCLAQMNLTSQRMYPAFFGSPEGSEGGAAFLAKRPPRFWQIRQGDMNGKRAGW